MQALPQACRSSRGSLLLPNLPDKRDLPDLTDDLIGLLSDLIDSSGDLIVPLLLFLSR